MKSINQFILLISVLFMTFIVSCDPEVCGYSSVENQTEHKVNIVSYYGYSEVNVKNFLIEPFGSTEKYESCIRGNKNHPPFSFLTSVDYIPVDSLDIVFNDTLFIRYFPTGWDCVTKNPLCHSCFIEEFNQPNNFTYTITGEDYQLALEQNLDQ